MVASLESLWHALAAFASMCRDLYEYHQEYSGYSWFCLILMIVVIVKFFTEISEIDKAHSYTLPPDKPAPVYGKRKPLTTPMFTKTVLENERISRVSLYPKAEERETKALNN